MKTTACYTILLVFLLFSCNRDEVIPPLPNETITNISYGTNPQQKFDLYLPANRSKSATKTLILIHGGGWTQGDKADMNYIVDIIKQNLPNYAIANINYRLATIGNPAFPMQIDDIDAIVTQLKTGNYDISNNFGCIGVSAGGHLSLLYGYGYNHDIKMVCSIVGPTDFTDTNYLSDPTLAPLFASVTGVNYNDNPTYYQQLSPLCRATSTSPPTIMLYGNADPLIPTTQGVNLHNRLDELGVYNEFNLYNGGHGNWSTPDLYDAYGKMVTFIQHKF